MINTRLNKADIFKEADILFEKGITPTAKKIRIQLGSGSLTTITKYLNDWKLVPRNFEYDFNELVIKIPNEKLADFFSSEHPQISSLIFSNLEAKKVAGILHFFTEEMRIDILKRIESLSPVQTIILEAVYKVLKSEFAAFNEPQVEQFGGRGFAEKIRKELVEQI